MKAIVIGAGLAGLVAARTLHRAGWEVVVLEAGDGLGGRVRTDLVQGFRLDRGFQALFTAYPAVKRQLDLKALKPRKFDPGVIVVEGKRWNEIGDPYRDWKSLFPSLLSTVPTNRDKLLVLRLRRELRRRPTTEVVRTPDSTTLEFLRQYGFSAQFIELFFEGLFGGIFLDRTLSTSARCFLFDFKMMAAGDAIVPRDGMQAIPEQIAQTLPAGSIRLNTPALRLEKRGGRVVGVQTSSQGIEGDVVIVAAHSPESERLSGQQLPKDACSTTCLHFGLPYPLYGHKKVIVNGYPDGFVNNAVQISNIAASYAREAEHLLSVTILDAPDMTAEQLTERSLADLQRWFPWRDISRLRPLAIYQVPFAQLRQPPGFHASLPSNRTSTKGLYLAGEYTVASSMNGAMLSGERAAKAVLADSAQQ